MFKWFRNRSLLSDGPDQGKTWLVCGLGNPGDRYSRNWHNCGFMVLDILAQRHHLPIRRNRCQSLISQGTLQGSRVILQKPQTFMNKSGQAVRDTLTYFRIDPAQCLIIYDDVDLPVGQLRIRPGGGPGTHNGMRSIISCLGQDQFPRLRIGIGPKPPRMNMADFVLSDIPADQREIFWQVLDQAADAVEVLVREGLQQAMAAHNRR